MKPSTALLAAIFAGFALNAAAQAPAAAAAPAGPVKIAVINFQAAVAQTNEFQRDFADLTKKFTPKRDQLQATSTEIENLKKQLQSQAATLSDADKASRARAIDDKQKKLQRDAEDAQNDFQQEMQQTYGTVAQKVGQVLISYSEEHGYTVVLDGGDQQAPVVLYAAPSTNITKEIIDAYNVKSGVPAPPPPAAGAPAAPRPAAAKPAAKPAAH
ncbi:MAG TPA: OmpH family outer membrane protein [Terracidiphilus sp.]